MQLPTEERERIALTLLDSVGKGPVDDELDDAWCEEVAQRLADRRGGRATARPWDAVRTDLLAKLRGP